MLTMIRFGQVRGMHLVSWLPCVVGVWVSLLLDEVLERPRPPMTSVVEYGLNLVLLFSADKVRWWPCEVGAMCGRFAIGR
jgi:hypothetical protein